MRVRRHRPQRAPAGPRRVRRAGQPEGASGVPQLPGPDPVRGGAAGGAPGRQPGRPCDRPAARRSPGTRGRARPHARGRLRAGVGDRHRRGGDAGGRAGGLRRVAVGARGALRRRPRRGGPRPLRRIGEGRQRRRDHGANRRRRGARRGCQPFAGRLHQDRSLLTVGLTSRSVAITLCDGLAKQWSLSGHDWPAAACEGSQSDHDDPSFTWLGVDEVCRAHSAATRLRLESNRGEAPRRRRVSMRTRPRGVAITIGIAALATIASACGGGSGSTPGATQTQNPKDLGFQKAALNNEGAGTPVKGGTLNVLSSTDTDYLDANVTYYSAGYAYIREIVRGLYNYPANPGHTTDVVPDVATAAPEISSDGLTYTITLKKGVFWNTTPKREITAADVVRGVKVACNPVQPFGGLPDFDFLIEGYKDFCAGFAKVGQSAKAIGDYVEKTSFTGVTAKDPSTVG